MNYPRGPLLYLNTGCWAQDVERRIVNRRIKFGPCRLCQREVRLTFHHLIPRKLHKRKRYAKQYTREQLNDGIMICQRCHKGLHRLYSETELGSELNTEKALLDDDAVARHISWVAKQKS